MKTSLVIPQMDPRTLVYFALGGSGIRTIEPLLHLCALGLGPRRLKLVLIDSDQSNAAVTRSRRLVRMYGEVRAAIPGGSPEGGYFRTDIVELVQGRQVWSPIADEEHLPDTRFATRVDRPLMAHGRSAPLGHLFDLLFPRQIRDMDLALGFRGIPSIGTVFMDRLRQEPFFEQLLTEAQTEPDRVFCSVGSIFGGTGAAAFPVVGRALISGVHRHDGTEVGGIPKRRIGGVVLLPYFTLPAAASRTARDGGPRPQAALFAQNASAAIPTYAQDQAGYGGLYMLGDSMPREQEKNEVGGEQQANLSHYIEMFAALAALDFCARGGESPDRSLPVFRTVAVEGQSVNWSDLPLDEPSLTRLMGGIIAAHTFLRVLRPDARSEPNLGGLLRGATWLELLGISEAQLGSLSTAFDALGSYYDGLWSWLGELRGSSPALELAPAHDRSPTQVRLDQTIEGRRRAGKPRQVKDDFEAFCHWNLAAYRRSNQGFAGLLETMREGSELFAKEHFAERSQPEHK